jgi:hypothetical protein
MVPTPAGGIFGRRGLRWILAQIIKIEAMLAEVLVAQKSNLDMVRQLEERRLVTDENNNHNMITILMVVAQDGAINQRITHARFEHILLHRQLMEAEYDLQRAEHALMALEVASPELELREVKLEIARGNIAGFEVDIVDLKEKIEAQEANIKALEGQTKLDKMTLVGGRLCVPEQIIEVGGSADERVEQVRSRSQRTYHDADPDE